MNYVIYKSKINKLKYLESIKAKYSLVIDLFLHFCQKTKNI